MTSSTTSPAVSSSGPRLTPVSPRTFRWGILGAGAIATDFVHTLTLNVPDARIQHIGARSTASAQALASRFGAARAGSYEDVVSDSEVDVVYVGTVHTMHKEHALMAIRKGKAVLVEKPFTINAKEAEEVLEAAKGRQSRAHSRVEFRGVSRS